MDQQITGVRIHPGIGVARVGNSATEFLIGPEVPYPQAQKPRHRRQKPRHRRESVGDKSVTKYC